VCGAPLCGGCQHSITGKGHITKVAFQQECDERGKTERETKLSRTSSERRLDKKTGLPLNLFELLKGDWKGEGYQLQKCYYLALEHGLMGFFPAIVKSDKRMVITTDQSLLTDIWKLLSPRHSKMRSFTGYVHERKGVVYPDKTEQFEQEQATPEALLGRKTFEQLVAKEKESFEWAPGLVGPDMSPKEFLETIKATQKQFA